MVSGPLSNEEFNELLKLFNLNGKVAIAVSGGADSIALALLIKQWGGCPIIALTVDHQLRPESTAEAEMVQGWMHAQEIEHHILTWDHPPIISGIQRKARQARYQLLSEWCLKNNVPTLMTAHHLHDQWETFFMRLSKGSGLTGLRGIRPVIKTAFGQLIRPLLSIAPECLKETLKFWNHSFIDDPSNNNQKFTRIRWRKLLPTLAVEGLTPETLQKTLIQFQAAEDYLEQQVEKAVQDCFQDFTGLSLEKFRKLPAEIARRVLKTLLLKIGQSSYPLNYASLQRLYFKLIDPKFQGATGGGCYLKRCQGGGIRITKELPRKLVR